MANVRVSQLQIQLQRAHTTLIETVQNISSAQAHWHPTNKAQSIAANLAHVIAQEDYVVNAMLQRQNPLLTTSYAGSSVLSENPPVLKDHIPNWQAWGERLRIDLPKLLAYGDDVFGRTDQYLGALSDEDLDTILQTFLGEMTLFDLLNLVILSNCLWHTGEISAIKGLQNLRGYPF